MTAHDDDPRDDALQALFQETAPDDDPLAVQRLARHAAQIPERQASRRPWWLVVPGIGALLAAAAAAWFVMQPPVAPQGPLASSTSPAPTIAAVPSGELGWFDGATASLWSDGEDGEDDAVELPAVVDDPLAVLDGSEGGDPLGPLELLLEPSDEDLDLYLSTYTAMLER